MVDGIWGRFSPAGEGTMVSNCACIARTSWETMVASRTLDVFAFRGTFFSEFGFLTSITPRQQKVLGHSTACRS